MHPREVEKAMTEIAKEVPAKKEGQDQLESVRSDNFVKLYANSARVETTFWDMKIFFGEIVITTGAKPYLEESVSVAMSPQHAKALLGVLSQNVSQYESMFGKLPSPPEPGVQAPQGVEAPKKP
jgi:hypothetical protein